MNDKLNELYLKLKREGKISKEQEEIIKRELESKIELDDADLYSFFLDIAPGLYSYSDINTFLDLKNNDSYVSGLKTLEELLEQDKQRSNDGFPRRIRLGKIVRPSKDSKGKVVIVPTTTEPKFYHDNSITEDGQGQGNSTGGAGEGEEGEVIGEQQAEPQQGEGEGTGAGEGDGANHEMTQEAFDLGRVLTEKFNLPNLKNKGNKRSFSKITYDLTDVNRRFGQLLEKKLTLKRLIKTNILLKRIKGNEVFDPKDLVMNPMDHIYRIMSAEKEFESQAVVFFLRDYSGSMQGKPTEVISSQHLFIYSWLVYQYKNKVETRFIVHDTEAKEVEDFYTYYKSQVAGGTKVAPAFKLVNKIVEEENLVKDYNIYIFHGTDGDDWDNSGKELIPEIKKCLSYVSRIGITVAKNTWGAGRQTTVEKSIESSGLLSEYPQLIRIDGLNADSATEDRIIEGIRKLTD